MYRIRGRRIAIALLSLVGLMCLALGTGRAVCLQDLHNTGVSSAGALLPTGFPELHYSVMGPGPTTTAAILEPHHAWITALPAAQWIGPAGGNLDAPNGEYLYELQFDLTGFDPASASLSGAWASDNESRILLNGLETGDIRPELGFVTLADFQITSGFVEGINTLTFAVTNSAPGGPSGLLVTELQGAAEPDPAQTFVVSSSIGIAHALAVEGTLSDQIAQLNGGPPPFGAEWGVVARHVDRHVPASLVCELPALLDSSYVSADDFILGADEVTLDNCRSAFYRWTFDLPPSLSHASLQGIANVDDQAVAFLNGTRITGVMHDPQCEPDPEVGPSDACYSLQDAGNDTTDADGELILTWPTTDPFGTCDITLFLPGTNELVFAVCGDASFFEPTGVEFSADVTFREAALATRTEPSLTVPLATLLNTPSPNPALGRSEVAYALEAPSLVELRIYDMRGRTVRTLRRGAEEAGLHRVAWDGRDSGGALVPNGVYFIRLDVAGTVSTRKLTLVR